MPVQLQGTLSIKEVNGRSGSFCVGDLVTDIGTFKVKDAILDQYPAGEYAGNFVIAEIYPYSYTWRGKVWVEVRAQLSAIHVDSQPEEAPDTEALPASVEPDPADEAAVPRPETQPVVVDHQETPAPDAEPSLFDAETQGLIGAGQPVKLDPTVDRGLFRAQRDALKGLGYRFDARGQTWEMPGE